MNKPIVAIVAGLCVGGCAHPMPQTHVNSARAHFDQGVYYLEMGELGNAISSFSRTIRSKNRSGESDSRARSVG